MSFYACCDRSGLIRVLPQVPTGTLLIADDPDEALLTTVVRSIAHDAPEGFDGSVPGLSLGTDGPSALDAVLAFRRRVIRSLAVEAQS